MSNAPKTVLAIHDLPGFGRAALSVIVPVLSCLGVQAVALPTAVLSTHTGGLGTPAKLSNPGYGPAALAHYQRLGLRFDCSDGQFPLRADIPRRIAPSVAGVG